MLIYLSISSYLPFVSHLFTNLPHSFTFFTLSTWYIKCSQSPSTSFTINNIHYSPFGGYYTPYIVHIIQFKSLCWSSYAFVNCFNNLSNQRRDIRILNISNSVYCLWLDNRQFEWFSFFEHRTPNHPSKYNIQYTDTRYKCRYLFKYMFLWILNNNINTQQFNLIDIFIRSSYIFLQLEHVILTFFSSLLRMALCQCFVVCHVIMFHNFLDIVVYRWIIE